MATGLDRLAVRFGSLVYRAHHPGWAYQPTSGEGAGRHGGRFNRKGLALLYTLLGITIAWMETQQGFPFKARPMTPVSYRICCERIADLIDAARLAAVGTGTMASLTPEPGALALGRWAALLGQRHRRRRTTSERYKELGVDLA